MKMPACRDSVENHKREWCSKKLCESSFLMAGQEKANGEEEMKMCLYEPLVGHDLGKCNETRVWSMIAEVDAQNDAEKSMKQFFSSSIWTCWHHPCMHSSSSRHIGCIRSICCLSPSDSNLNANTHWKCRSCQKSHCVASVSQCMKSSSVYHRQLASTIFCAFSHINFVLLVCCANFTPLLWCDIFQHSNPLFISGHQNNDLRPFIQLKNKPCHTTSHQK